MKTLYVGNINYHATRDILVDLFTPYGEVMGIALPIDFQTKQIRGFAFVEFERPEDARLACEKTNRLHFMGRELSVRLIDRQIVER